ncbi:MAG TPA: 50S ribosomal protein L19 [Bacteroidetes bacterium]|nr:50S ribosomal protein L19 [Bacteroidota bacterium]HEX05448.1 50S ribosomal protein L19 [Bacteroidota bacterium]
MSDLIIQELERREAHMDVPEFGPGDTVSVHTRVIEGNKERIQIFRGTVIRVRGNSGHGSFTVRKISSGIGVERVFPFNSPTIAKIERDRIGRVRRAKLYYLRDRLGKSARVKEKLPPQKSKA